jgi:hypothetical protein
MDDADCTAYNTYLELCVQNPNCYCITDYNTIFLCVHNCSDFDNFNICRSYKRALDLNMDCGWGLLEDGSEGCAEEKDVIRCEKLSVEKCNEYVFIYYLTYSC